MRARRAGPAARAARGSRPGGRRAAAVLRVPRNAPGRRWPAGSRCRRRSLRIARPRAPARSPATSRRSPSTAADTDSRRTPDGCDPTSATARRAGSRAPWRRAGPGAAGRAELCRGRRRGRLPRRSIRSRAGSDSGRRARGIRLRGRTAALWASCREAAGARTASTTGRRWTPTRQRRPRVRVRRGIRFCDRAAAPVDRARSIGRAEPRAGPRPAAGPQPPPTDRRRSSSAVPARSRWAGDRRPTPRRPGQATPRRSRRRTPRRHRHRTRRRSPRHSPR